MELTEIKKLQMMVKFKDLNIEVYKNEIVDLKAEIFELQKQLNNIKKRLN
jgi:hypothetical protein